MKLRAALLSIVVGIMLLTSPTTLCGQSIGWTFVNWKVHHDFPGVRRIEPKQVADWIADNSRVQSVLLDVRTKPEFEVSDIHGARRVDPDESADAVKLPKDQPIVTYCSVGYRSAAFAKKLQDAGYTNVQNMTGSIFEWANDGRPVEHEGQRVHEVHPYNSTWGKFLKPELRADIPANQTGM